MFEKVNPAHPDKIADRIAGALVDLAYKNQDNPQVAVEVLIGHGECYIISESSFMFRFQEVSEIVKRICPEVKHIFLNYHSQDKHLANNQAILRCGDNGIFKGTPITEEQSDLSKIARNIYNKYQSDGKYILDKEDDNKLIICQSRVYSPQLQSEYPDAIVNPLGDWTGGINVDAGATNRKLGSDMGDSITGGGLHGKDLSKGDISINIYAFLKAQELDEPVEYKCAIGDDIVNGIPFTEIVEIAREYINRIGGFEKFAEWGFI